MIVDRGFRDTTEGWQQLGYEIRMPAFLKKGEKQHSTTHINLLRLCTKNSVVSRSILWKAKKMANVR